MKSIALFLGLALLGSWPHAASGAADTQRIAFSWDGREYAADVGPLIDDIEACPYPDPGSSDEAWSAFFERRVGRGMKPERRQLFLDLGEQLSRETNDPDRLYCLALALVKAIGDERDRRETDGRALDSAPEGALRRPNREEALHLLAAGLLSALCYPIEFVETGGVWRLVLPLAVGEQGREWSERGQAVGRRPESGLPVFRQPSGLATVIRPRILCPDHQPLRQPVDPLCPGLRPEKEFPPPRKIRGATGRGPTLNLPPPLRREQNVPASDERRHFPLGIQR